MARKQTLYVSSTFQDLEAHRAVLKVELERAGYDVESMERYAAFAEPPLAKCLSDVAACDGYVLLLAHRHGFVPQADNPQGRSITELEYEHALQCHKPVFAFCVHEDHPWSPRLIDRGEPADRLASFRLRVETSHGRGQFTDPDNLAKQVLSALSVHAWPASAEAVAASSTARANTYRWPTPWDFSTYIDDKREVFEGRDWLFDDIARWQTASQARALLIRADFGVGKSAAMAELVHRNPGGGIAAWHFCQHDTQETLQPGAFVRSLAAQLAATVPGYKDLVDADPALQERLDRALTDPGSALDGAVLAPLARLPAPPAPRLLVVDALDEALELDSAGTGAPAHARVTIISLLAAKAGRFPAWLRVLATSRPNPQVLTPLNAFGIQEIDAESAGHQADLQHYILRRCAREPLASILPAQGQAAAPLAQLLVQRSQGKFLYAVRALRDLENRHIGVEELAALPPGMDSFYLDAFERRFARAGRDYGAARRVLGVLATAREPLPVAVVAAVLGTADADVKAVHRALPDFLRQHAGKLSFDHFSMAEWLTRDDDDGFARAGDYTVDAQASQAAMRQWALQQVAQGTAHRSDYLLRHLPAHLSDEDERRRVWGGLMLERFEWLQARLDQAGPDALIADAQALAGVPGQAMLLALLRNSAAVLRQHPDQWAGQVLGRAGDDVPALHALASSARQWLVDADPARTGRLLVPCSRSLRLSTSLEVTLEIGNRASLVFGNPLIVLPGGRIAAGTGHGAVRIWDTTHLTEPIDLVGHRREITALAALADGRIASGSDDSTVRLWDPVRPQDSLVFEGHSGEINALAVLSDGRIASGAIDHVVRLWNPERPDERLVLKGHSGPVTALVVLPDGRLASSSQDQTVRVWDLANPEASVLYTGHSRGVNALAVLPDGRLASAGLDGVHVWKPSHPIQQVVFETEFGSKRPLVTMPDGRIVLGPSHGFVTLWNPAHPTENSEIKVRGGPGTALAALPDGRIAYVFAGAHTVSILDPERLSESIDLEGHTGTIGAAAVLPDGRIATASKDGTVRLWDPRRRSKPVVYKGHSARVIALAALPDGRVVSASVNSSVYVWDLHCFDTPVDTEHFEVAHFNGVVALIVLPDGRIASGSGFGDVHLWDPACPGKELVLDVEGSSNRVMQLAVLDDGRITWGSRRGTVHVWNPAHGTETLVLNGHAAPVTALAVLPDGQIASSSIDGTVRVWDPACPDKPVVVVLGTRGNALAVLPDGRIASDAGYGELCVLDPAQPSERVSLNLHLRSVTALAILPDGRIASGSEDCTVRLFDPVRATQPVTLEGHTGTVNALVALPDGRIASGARDAGVRLWDPTGKRPDSIFIADSSVSCLIATPGFIIAGCGDGGVHFLRPAP